MAGGKDGVGVECARVTPPPTPPLQDHARILVLSLRSESPSRGRRLLPGLCFRVAGLCFRVAAPLGLPGLLLERPAVQEALAVP